MSSDNGGGGGGCSAMEESSMAHKKGNFLLLGVSVFFRWKWNRTVCVCFFGVRFNSVLCSVY